MFRSDVPTSPPGRARIPTAAGPGTPAPPAVPPPAHPPAPAPPAAPAPVPAHPPAAPAARSRTSSLKAFTRAESAWRAKGDGFPSPFFLPFYRPSILYLSLNSSLTSATMLSCIRSLFNSIQKNKADTSRKRAVTAGAVTALSKGGFFIPALQPHCTSAPGSCHRRRSPRSALPSFSQPGRKTVRQR